MEAYTDSVEAAKTRISNATEKWALELDQGKVLKWFYNTIADITENLGQMLSVIGIFLTLTNGTKIASTVATGAGILGTRAMQFGNYFSNVGTQGGALNSFTSSFKEQTEQSFLIQQQKLYGNALAKVTTGLNEQVQSQAQQLQANILQLDSTQKVEMSQVMLALANGESAEAALSSASMETMLALSAKLLSAAEYKAMGELLQGKDEDQQLNIVRQQLAAAMKNYTEVLNKETLKTIGTNVGKSGQVTPKSSMMSGLTSMGGMLIGSIGGGEIFNLVGADSTVGSTIGGLIGPLLANKIANGVDLNTIKSFKDSGVSLGTALKKGISGLGKGAAGTAGLTAAGLGLGALAVAAIIKGIKKARKESLKNLQDAFQEDVSTYNDMKSQIITASKFDKLNNGVDSLGRNVSLSDEEYQQYLDYSNQLAKVFPSLVLRTDEAGNKIIGLGNAVGDVTEAIEEMTKAAQQEADASFVEEDFWGQSVFKDNIGTSKDKIKDIEKQRKKAKDSNYGKGHSSEEVYDLNVNSNAKSDELIDQDYDRQVEAVKASMVDDYKSYIRNLAAQGDVVASSLLEDMTDEESVLYEQALQNIDLTKSKKKIKKQIENTIENLNNVFAQWETEGEIGINGESYSMSQLATMSYGDFDFVKNAEQARDTLKQWLLDNYGKDVGKWTDEQKQFAISIGFEIDGDSLKDVENTLLKLKESLGLTEDSKLTGAYKDAENWTIDQLNTVYELVTGGYIDINTSSKALANVLASKPTTAKAAKQRANIIQDNYQTTAESITSDFVNLGRGDLNGGIVKEIEDENGEIKKVVDTNYVLENYGYLGEQMVEQITDDAQDIIDVVEDTGSTADDKAKIAAEKIKSTLEQYDTATLSALKDAAQKYSQEVFSSVETGSDGFISSAEEMVAMIDSMTNAFEKLDKAQSDFAQNGTVSLRSVFDLLSESASYIDLFDFSGDNIKVVDNAEQKMWEIQKEAFIAQLDAQKSQITLEIEQLKVQNEQIKAKGEYVDASLMASVNIIEALNEEGNTVAALANQYLLLGDAAAYAEMCRRGDIEGAAQYKTSATTSDYSIEFEKTDTKALEDKAKVSGDLAQAQYDANEAAIKQKEAQLGLLDKEYELAEKVKSTEDYTTLFDSTANLDDYKDANKELDKLKSKLGAINKEYYDMAKFKGWALDDTVYKESGYYDSMRSTLTEIITLLEQKLALELASNGVTEEYLEMLQQYQDYVVQRENLDDQEAEDRISILESQHLLNDKVIEAYEALVATADTEAEMYEYQERLNEKIKEYKELLFTTLQYEQEILQTRLQYESGTPTSSLYNSLIQQSEANLRQQMENAADRAATAYKLIYDAAMGEGYSSSEAAEQASRDPDYQDAVKDYIDAFQAIGDLVIQAFEDKVDELQQKIDDMGDAKAKKWTSIENIEQYYKELDELYNYILDTSKKTLEDTSEMTDEQIQDVVDQANDAIKSINDNMIDMYEDIKSYQEDIYSALTKEVDRYKDELESQKELVTEMYDEEIEKLTDKQQSIERTNKLLQIQNNLENAQNEKQRVYREGIGWVYESDHNKIKEAEKELKAFQLQDQIDDLTNARDAELEVLDKRIDNWNTYLEQLDQKYNEYETLQQQKLLRELLGIETQEQLEQMIMQDMDSFINYLDNNQDRLLESMSDTYLGFGSTFDGFLDSYKDNLKTLDYYNTKTLDLLKATDYNGHNGEELLDYLDNTVELTQEQRSYIRAAIAEEKGWVDVDYYGKDTNDYSRRNYTYNTNADSSVVSAAQSYLKNKYQDSILVDGKLGDQTASAIMQAAANGDSTAQYYAQQLGISYSGYTTPGGYTSTITSGTSSSSTSGVYKKGSTGTTVSNIQDFLNNGGYYTAVEKNSGITTNVDGDYGSRTEDAVKYFQRTHGCVEDGIVGPETLAAMRAAGYSYSGGLEEGPVTYTGIAMLHGTPSSPEYVLNSDQAYSLLRYMSTHEPKYTKTPSTENTTYSYGDIIMNGVNDPEAFFSELTSAMSRRYSTTKNRR